MSLANYAQLQLDWSIHDVAPHTQAQVEALCQSLPRDLPQPPMLLVIPGLDWQPAQIDWLRQKQQAGFVLVAHGWQHQALAKRTLWHRLHAAMLSRDAAEHLSRSRAELQQRTADSVQWFAANDLITPQYYVPPAWALGALQPQDLLPLGVQRVETLAGYRSTQTGRLQPAALIGFEADTPLRARLLRACNALQGPLARQSGWRLRIAIHPNDLTLHLRDDLRALLSPPPRLA